MLPKQNRLPLRKERDTLSASGKKYSSPLFTYIYSPNSNNHPRLSTLISKKLEPKAVNRNKLRRTINASFSTLLLTLPNHDFLLIPKPAAKTASQAQIKQDLQNFLKNLN